MIAEEVPLRSGVGAWFTGRASDGSGNLAHRRPHRPGELASAREELAVRTDTDPARWHLMQQVHGANVATVDADTPLGAELRGVDAVVTTEVNRPLVVQVADCVPVLVAGPRAIAAIHAGRAGVEGGVVPRAIDAMHRLGDAAADCVALIGPAIGGCCYEVPSPMRSAVAEVAPGAAATTTWGTPALDLPAAVQEQLTAAGVVSVRRVGGCTRCDAERRWFSHRADAASGRQVGLVVRQEVAP